MSELKWKEWDMISGGLEAFIENEEEWLDDSRPDVVEMTEVTLLKLRKLMARVDTIKRKVWRQEMGMIR